MNKIIPYIAILLFLSCTQKEKGYFDTGELFYIVEIKNGKKNGVLKEYYKNGNIRVISEYYDDKLHGTSVFYTEEGIKDQTVQYENGIISGESITYYKNGNVKSKIFYINNKREGEYHFFNEKGDTIIYAYAEKGFTRYFLEFDMQKDSVVKQKRYLSINVDSDTILLGDSLNVNVKTYGPLNNMSKFYIYVIDSISNDTLIKSNEVPVLRDGYEFNFTPIKTGVIYIKSIFSSRDTLIVERAENKKYIHVVGD